MLLFPGVTANKKANKKAKGTQELAPNFILQVQTLSLKELQRPSNVDTLKLPYTYLLSLLLPWQNLFFSSAIVFLPLAPAGPRHGRGRAPIRACYFGPENGGLQHFNIASCSGAPSSSWPWTRVERLCGAISRAWGPWLEPLLRIGSLGHASWLKRGIAAVLNTKYRQ